MCRNMSSLDKKLLKQAKTMLLSFATMKLCSTYPITPQELETNDIYYLTGSETTRMANFWLKSGEYF